MKVLVTGAAGFIGGNLIAKLRGAGHVVRRLDCRPMAPIACDDSIFGDVCDQGAAVRAAAGVDAVVHLAAMTGIASSVANPARCVAVNVGGTQTMLAACRPGTRFILASTAGAIAGDNAAPCREDMLPRPVSPYGASKLAAEALCGVYAATFGLSCVSLRFANVYGPGSLRKATLIAQACRALVDGTVLTIYGDGQQLRDYVSVADVCDSIVAELNSGLDGAHNVGTGVASSTMQVIEALEQIAGRRLALRREAQRPGEVMAAWCAMEQSRLAAIPRTSLLDGLQDTFQWFARTPMA